MDATSVSDFFWPKADWHQRFLLVPRYSSISGRIVWGPTMVGTYIIHSPGRAADLELTFYMEPGEYSFWALTQ